MVSWSGSLFEYLMPELFLPLYRGSHLWESARFAVYVQRRRTFGAKKLWGISESAFYAFDATDHYRYKAHGWAPPAPCRQAAFGAGTVASVSENKNPRLLASRGFLRMTTRAGHRLL